MNTDKAKKFLRSQKRTVNMFSSRTRSTDVQVAVAGAEHAIYYFMVYVGMFVMIGTSAELTLLGLFAEFLMIGFIVWQVLVNRKLVRIRDYLIENNIQKLNEITTANKSSDPT